MAERPALPRGVRHVVIVGLMGTGKTTVGALLAARLGWPLQDSDPAIEAATGRTVRELRDEIGVDAMHALEARELLDALAGAGSSVIAAAASVVDDAGCRAALRSTGIAVVWLTASPRVAAARFRGGHHRPWYGTDPERFIAEQAAIREPLFRSLRPMELATDDVSPDAVASIVLERLAALDPRRTAVGDAPADPP